MTKPEPKCIQWKRQGAERVAAQTATMSPEQEIEFWCNKTKQLRERLAKEDQKVINEFSQLHPSQ